MVKIIFNCKTENEMYKQREIVHKGLVGSPAYINSEIAVCDMDETTFCVIIGNLNDNNVRIPVKKIKEEA